MRGVKVLIKTSQVCLKEDDIWPNPWAVLPAVGS
jgi:hypothetical protein